MNKEIDFIFSPEAIRERTGKLYDLTKEGKTHFELNEDKLKETADFVLEVIKDNYPSLEIPFHSRWGHFKVGDINRVDILDDKMKDADAIEKARTKLDLVITSVLLDAGAGPTWKFVEDGKTFNRSEGLGVASFHMFMKGAFSNNTSLKADGASLKNISAKDVENHFQVSEDNPLVGAEGRAGLLRSLGDCVSSNKEAFKDARPGNIIDYMIQKHGKSFKAKDLLKAVLELFGPIWPSRINLYDTNLGDVWRHPLLGDMDKDESLVPFHKLSQWLTYSLIEPIMEAGIDVSDAHEMTGLAEYRNGGLFVDMGVISLKDSSLLDVAHKPDSEVIIEWRALTIQLLDRIADLVRENLNFTANDFPLAKVLEGGTWWAGRRVAKEKRADSSPPLKLDSDGTVF
ncbi:MAG: uracil phosphoribosyltransferase [Halobacteriovorax sp.]|nr:uracil phosphoribosyltransferase [Halobacteriovorax sp.]